MFNINIHVLPSSTNGTIPPVESHLSFLPRAHAQGVKQSVCPSVVVVVVVVVGTKIAISRVLGVFTSYKHNQSVDIGAKLVYTRFELLKKA